MRNKKAPSAMKFSGLAIRHVFYAAHREICTTSRMHKCSLSPSCDTFLRLTFLVQTSAAAARRRWRHFWEAGAPSTGSLPRSSPANYACLFLPLLCLSVLFVFPLFLSRSLLLFFSDNSVSLNPKPSSCFPLFTIRSTFTSLFILPTYDFI